MDDHSVPASVDKNKPMPLWNRLPGDLQNKGWILNKRTNAYLKSLCDYLDSTQPDQTSVAYVLELETRLSVSKNDGERDREKLYRFLKKELLSNSVDPSALKCLEAWKPMLKPGEDNLPPDLSVNLNLAYVQAQKAFADGRIDSEELMSIMRLYHLFDIPETDMRQIYQAASAPSVDRILEAGGRDGKVSREEADSIRVYALLLTGMEMNYDNARLKKFLNAYNRVQLRDGGPLLRLSINNGYKTFSISGNYWTSHCRVQRVGGRNSSDSRMEVYVYDECLVFIDLIRTELVMPENVLNLKESIYAVDNTSLYKWDEKESKISWTLSHFDDPEAARLCFLVLKGQAPENLNGPFTPPVATASPGVKSEDYRSSGSDTQGGSGRKKQKSLQELDQLVGLASVKEQMKSLSNMVSLQQQRAAAGLQVVQVSLHSVFTGAPGTGKTTVARLYADMLRELGVLQKGHLVEVDRAGLVAGYSGQTAIKTDEVITRALDGVLFIDEAYSLAPEKGDDSYGQEAVNTLLKRMEDYRNRLVLVVAGYTDEMDRFIGSNPGLASRFNRTVFFPNYGAEEMVEICKRVAKANDYEIDPTLAEALLSHLKHKSSAAGEDFGNARYVRNLFETMVVAHSNRLASLENPDRAHLTRLESEDLTEAVRVIS